ncbi:MAG: response regulator [Anaerolineae bacterium]|nr:MAG: response regulator [Anaerolineae bacterium]
MTTEQTIRVVIVDDVREARENIRKLLQFEKDIEVVGMASTGREGIQMARETSPDVILMDINMPDMDGIKATESIHQELPHIQIVILSVQGDPNYMRRAMLAGARDFLTKPPMVDELIAAIRRAGKIAHEEKRKVEERYVPERAAVAPGGDYMAASGAYGKVIVVYSPKGGVGTTTVATNLAVTLHNPETPVVLVDGKIQFGDLMVMLNVRGKNNITDLAPRADELDPEIIEEVLITHGDTGMKLLAAPLRPEQSEDINGEQFGKILAYLRRLYAYVVVDAGSHLTDVAISAMDASSLLILLTMQDIPSINDVRLFLDLAGALGLGSERILLALSRFDKRIAITPEAIGNNLKHEVAVVIPQEERVVLPSVNRGKPFILTERKRPVSRAILELAEKVRQRLAELESVQEI